MNGNRVGPSGNTHQFQSRKNVVNRLRNVTKQVFGELAERLSHRDLIVDSALVLERDNWRREDIQEVLSNVFLRELFRNRKRGDEADLERRVSFECFEQRTSCS